MTDKKKRFYFSEKFAPWLLLIFSLAAYLPLVNQLGFFWDDWPMLWFKVTRGAEGFAHAFDSDRPFLGHLYRLTASLLSFDPREWQIMTVIFRWAVTASFWWMLRLLWPDRKREAFWISMLLAVYPGFKQMPIAYVWMNAFVMLLAYILSYGMMLKAAGSGSRKAWILWTVPAVLLYTFCTISTEYYTGLDISRGVILWIFFARQAGFRELSFWKKVRKVFVQWLPYLAVLGAFMVWRVFIFKFPSYQPVLLSEMDSNFLGSIVKLGARIVNDAYTATWAAWTEFFRFPTLEDFSLASGKAFWLSVVLTFVAALVVSFLYRPEVSDSEDGTGDPLKWCLIAMGLGLFMVICPGLPYWVTALPIRLSYPFDRFLVAFMFGSSIFMVGLVGYFLRSRTQRNVVLCLFMAMAVGGSILNANSYRKDWMMQQDFTEQLVTRIPSLEHSTILLADDNPLAYESDNSLTGLVNLALDPDPVDETLPYSVLLLTSRFGSAENFISQKHIYQEFRGSIFSGKPDDVVVYHYSPPGCLRIIDPEQHADLNIFPDSYKTFMHLSDPKGRIDPEGVPFTFLQDKVFKQPVTQNWCYYFQKADLARQTEDWETIAAIGDDVLPRMKAGEASEYFIFVEAYIHMGRWQDAMALFPRIHAEGKSLDAIFCTHLRGWIEENKPEDRSVINSLIKAMNSVGCSISED